MNASSQSSEKQGLINELHSNARRNYPRRKVRILGINDLYQADLIDMSSFASVNKNHHFALIVINAFSKFAFAEPLKTKTGIEVTGKMKKILEKAPPPSNLTVDQGKEFYNKHFKELMRRYKINMYSVYSTKKASIVERLNRTLKNKMWKRFSLNGTYKWIDMLQSIIDEYNNDIHRTIGLKPAEVSKDDEKHILDRINRDNSNNKIKSRKKLKVGDYVRISKLKGAFEKSYLPNWSVENFKVIRVQPTHPTTYLLQDLHGKHIKGAFYNEELRKTCFKNVYLVEKVLRRRGKSSFVKWLGFPSTENSWIDSKNVI